MQKTSLRIVIPPRQVNAKNFGAHHIKFTNFHLSLQIKLPPTKPSFNHRNSASVEPFRIL
jgi:hypothetical protein